MRLLDRYLLREFLTPFGYCLSGFFIFWIVFDLFDHLGQFTRQGLTLLDVTEYYLVRLPELLVVVLPVALLLALLYSLTNHGRHHELVAIRAAGVSLSRLSLPYLLVGLVLSLTVFTLNEFWVPDSFHAAEEILNRRLDAPARAEEQQWERRFGFDNPRDGRRWGIQAFNLVTGEMIQPNVSWTMPDGTRHEVSAEQAAYRSGAWIFTNVTELVYPPAPGAFPTRRKNSVRVMGRFSETPEEIRNQIKISRINGFREARKAQLSIRQILEYKKWNPQHTRRSALLSTKLHGCIATPWTCLVVVLIALPFGAAAGRRSAYVGVASSVLITFAYVVLSQFSLAAGGAGYIPPILAAWIPNLVFAAIGSYLTWQLR